MIQLLDQYRNEDTRPKATPVPATGSSAPDLSPLSVEWTGRNGMVYIVNQIRGPSEGDPFTIVNDAPNTWVQQIKCFHKTVYGEFTVLKALYVEWNDGSTISLGDHSEDPDSRIWLNEKATITSCNLRAGGFVDGMDFGSNIAPYNKSVGGKGGHAYKQDIGNGRLMGFHGRKGKDIGTLGLIFEKK